MEGEMKGKCIMQTFRRVSCIEARLDMMEADRILLTVAQQLGSFRQFWVTAGPEAHMAAVDGYRTDLPSEKRSVFGKRLHSQPRVARNVATGRSAHGWGPAEPPHQQRATSSRQDGRQPSTTQQEHV